jgi:hypothetical protein
MSTKGGDASLTTLETTKFWDFLFYKYCYELNLLRVAAATSGPIRTGLKKEIKLWVISIAHLPLMMF